MPADLLALRAICHDIHNKVQRTFVDVHFTEKAFLMADEESMQALVDIAAHPVLGKALKSIVLQPVQVAFAWQFERAYEDTRDDRKQWTREQRIEHREARVRHQSLLAKHTKAWKMFSWQDALRQALEHLSASKQEVDIRVPYQGSTVASSACGTSRIERLCGASSCFRRFRVSEEAGARLLETVLASECMINAFENEQCDFSVPASLASASPGKSVCASLTSLDLHVSSVPTRAKEMILLLNQFTILEQLQLKCHPWLIDKRMFSELWTSLLFPRLQTAKFYGFRSSVEDIVTFVTKHHTHLEKLRVLDAESFDWQTTSSAKRLIIQQALAQRGIAFNLSGVQI